MSPEKRVLIFPDTNTLSHVSRALSLCVWLEDAGFETHIGVSNSRKSWTSQFWPRCHGVLELWEPSGKPFPTLHWFCDPSYCEACIISQEAVIEQVRPDLIIGIFDFISSISRKSIPRLTINGACMLPWNEKVLGFDDQPTPLREEQKKIFSAFWAFAAKSFAASLEKRGKAPLTSALALLSGDISCIYEIPEITGVGSVPPNNHFIGPIFWDGWNSIGETIPWTLQSTMPTAYLNSGTLMKDEQTMASIINECLVRGLRLLMSSGDKGPSWTTERVFCRPFIPPAQALSHADVVICTGGVGACYENLKYGIPSMVIPMQPEQAANGINLARNGCGEAYNFNVMFLGDEARYHIPFDRERFGVLFDRMMGGLDGYAGCGRMRDIIASCDTRSRIIELVKDLL